MSPGEGSSVPNWGSWCPGDLLVVDLPTSVAVRIGHLEGRMCPGHLLVVDLPASVVVRINHLEGRCVPGEELITSHCASA